MAFWGSFKFGALGAFRGGLFLRGLLFEHPNENWQKKDYNSDKDSR